MFKDLGCGASWPQVPRHMKDRVEIVKDRLRDVRV